MSSRDKKFWIGVGLITIWLIIACLVNIAKGQECTYTFTQIEANQIVVTGEKYKACMDLNKDLEEMVATARGMADSYAMAVAEQERIIEGMKTLSLKEKELCDKKIEDAQPSFWDRFKDGSYGAVVGALLTIIAIGAL